jgi:hypothetical protein
MDNNTYAGPLDALASSGSADGGASNLRLEISIARGGQVAHAPLCGDQASHLPAVLAQVEANRIRTTSPRHHACATGAEVKASLDRASPRTIRQNRASLSCDRVVAIGLAPPAQVPARPFVALQDNKGGEAKYEPALVFGEDERQMKFWATPRVTGR